MRNTIAPYIAQAFLSTGRLKRLRRKAERKRRQQKAPHKVTVYLRINDPYSYLLVQVLPDLQERFAIEYEFRTILNLQEEMYPAPTMWNQNAAEDGRFLADLYADVVPSGVTFPSSLPQSDSARDAAFTAQLLHWELQPGYLDNALELFHAYWQNDSAKRNLLLNSAITSSVECYQQHLRANEKLLSDNGHYLTGMLAYAGEWYWGLDRLSYLEMRLNELGIQKQPEDLKFRRTKDRFCQHISSEALHSLRGKQKQQTITMYFSSRSPYSYLGLVRVRDLAHHYGCELVVKPVLPMVMRRMQVPNKKGRYISLDAAREAKDYDIPFGRVADPLGKGVENCYALFEWASEQGKGVELLASVAKGNWAEGIRADTRSGLKRLVERAGLNWAEAKTRLNDDSWRLMAQQNLTELYSHRHWGVPCFKVDNLVVFGQDRLTRIEQALAGD